MSTLNRGDLARLIANETGDTITAASRFLTAFESVTKFALQSGKAIDLRGFIKLETTERAARTGHNPAKRVVKAKVSPSVLGGDE